MLVAQFVIACQDWLQCAIKIASILKSILGPLSTPLGASEQNHTKKLTEILQKKRTMKNMEFVHVAHMN